MTPVRRTVLAAFVALLGGAGATLALNAWVFQGHAVSTASAQYLAPVGRAPVPAPDFALPDQTGQTVSLSQFRGREVLITFMDPQCTGLCPVMGQEISAVESRLPARVKPVLLIVSVAPGRSAADVSKFVSKVSWQPGWHWLLGNQAQLQAVWASWQVNVIPAADVIHDEILFVVDPRGRTVGAYNAPLGTAEVASMITNHSTR